MSRANLLLLHGALGTEKQLLPLKEALQNDFQVYTLTFEGHGPYQSDNEFSISLFSQNVIDFMAGKGMKSAHLFGYSMGGYVALQLAIERPDLVNRIVTYGTKFLWNKTAAEKEVKMLHPDTILEKVPKYAEYLQRIHGSNWKEVLHQTARMMLKLGDYPHLTAKELLKIDQAVLICLGDKDQMVTLEESIKTVERLKNGELKLLKDFVHPLEQINAGELAQWIRQFITY